jgi:uncharacterized protein (TIGR00730 family)
VRVSESALSPELTGEDPRVLRDFHDAFEALKGLGPAVCIFGAAHGERVRPGEAMYEAARECARLLGLRGYAVLTGGGPGLMEAANRGAADAGVRSVGIGVPISFGADSNRYVDIELSPSRVFIRKTIFAHYAQGFVAFPGGIGTLDEVMAIAARMHYKRIPVSPLVLFGSLFWGGMLEWMRRGRDQGRLTNDELDLLSLANSAERVIELFDAAGARPATTS